MQTAKQVASQRVAKDTKKRLVSLQTKEKSMNTKRGTVKASVRTKTKGTKTKVSRLKIQDNTGKSTVAGRKLDKQKHKQRMKSKLEAVTLLQTKKTAKVAKSFSHSKKHSFPSFSIPKHIKKIPIAIAASYRFPIHTRSFAIGVARFGGLSFVVLGGFFTLFYANSSFNSQSQFAAVLSATDSTLSPLPVNDQNQPVSNSEAATNSPTSVQSAQNTASVHDSTPMATFNISATAPVFGVVPVHLSVQGATAISLSAYNVQQQQEYRIGSMALKDANTWQMDWDTTGFPDGQYVVKAIVTNANGSYEQVDQATVTVKNHSVALPPQLLSTSSQNVVGSTTLRTDSDAATNTLHATQAVLTADRTESSDVFNFQVNAKAATSVILYGYQKSSGKNNLLGYAYKASASLWNFRWVTSGLTVGAYVVSAVAIHAGVQDQTNSIAVTIMPPSAVTASSSNAAYPKLNNTNVGSTTLSVSAPVINPPIVITPEGSSPLSNMATIQIHVASAASVEMYAQKRYSLIRTYLGKASQVDTNTWLYRWDTTQSPNAEYALVAVVNNAYGSYEGQSDFATVLNVTDTSLTPKQNDAVQKLKDVAIEIKKNAAATSSTATSTTKTNTTVLTADQIKTAALLDPYKAQIQTNLDSLATALRSGNQDEINKAKDAIENTKQMIVQDSPELSQSQDLAARVDDVFSNDVTKVGNDVELTNKIIAQRTGTKASQDSDGDGISDYDEVNLYHTNPYVADTDGDGITDGAEILEGSDPLSPDAKEPVVYASPKESGIIREDILKVTSVTTAKPNIGATASTAPVAIITGKALPDSFVTLYIFSTPIVVTVKTDADGNWNYRFDKELEDGKHQVYIGMTDNTGDIIAKSQPFNFVKVAQAYSPEDASGTLQQSQTPVTQSLFSVYMIYLVLSISVVAIGLVLIMLGLHLDSTRTSEIALENEARTAV